MWGKLILSDGSEFIGKLEGSKTVAAGEVVFATGMTGYDQSITDPSFSGQILVFTYPLIGNWGMPKEELWESDKIHPVGLIVSDLTQEPNHWQMDQKLNESLIANNIVALVGIDTRQLTQKLRSHGVMLGKIVREDQDLDFQDPNTQNLVSQVSNKKLIIHKPDEMSKYKIGLLNCGAKRNIIRSLNQRGATVYEMPWDYNPFKNNLNLDGLMISNGPGDPKMAKESIEIIKIALKQKLPTFGICLGNQLLALAAGGDTYKLKFGHRSQNQPTIELGTKRCYITTQNHGYAVNEKKLPPGFRSWFINANDETNEGIKHEKLPFFSVQFHPESFPGPTDTQWLFDYFLERVKK